MHEIVMWISYRSDSRITIFMILIPTLIPLGLIPIQGFTKILDSDSNSESSRKWLRFSCFHKNNLIPILIPIPALCDSNFDSTKPGFLSNSDSGILIPIPESFKTLTPGKYAGEDLQYFNGPYTLFNSEILRNL